MYVIYVYYSKYMYACKYNWIHVQSELLHGHKLEFQMLASLYLKFSVTLDVLCNIIESV